MRFIVIDKMDGAGKDTHEDTHAQLIQCYYEAKGDTVPVRSPLTARSLGERRRPRDVRPIRHPLHPDV